MKKASYAISVCFIVVLAGCFYYFIKDEPIVPKGVTALSQEEQKSTLSYVGNSITENKDGKPIWKLGAESIEVDVNSKNMILKNINGTFYQDNGGKIEVTAPTAVVDSQTKDIIMTGKVHATASDGADFTAQETRWSGQQEVFYGSGDVFFTKEDTLMSGDKIESDKNMAKVKVSGHAKIVKGGALK